MDAYKNILVAVDLSPESKAVVRRAQQIQLRNDAHLSLVHVVEPLITDGAYELMPALPLEVEESLIVGVPISVKRALGPADGLTLFRHKTAGFP